MQKYAFCTMKLTENDLIHIRTLQFYFSKYQNDIFDENFIQ